jgi:hypothetical protein
MRGFIVLTVADVKLARRLRLSSIPGKPSTLAGARSGEVAELRSTNVRRAQSKTPPEEPLASNALIAGARFGTFRRRVEIV